MPAIGLGLSGEIQRFWKQQFQGPLYDFEEFSRILAQRKMLENRSDTLKLGLLQVINERSLRLSIKEVYRLLEPGAELVVQNSSKMYNSLISEILVDTGLQLVSEFDKFPTSLQLDWRPLLIFQK
ncbi:hypothetical protein HGG76_07965 [Ochrobactrum tritici]|uniref:Uncharacterized protein n=1 Tax=Brucella tritici TaxID=94626 RepID=A0A7X6JBJ4_9HYPH|nr:hypothetical protein [Brucella tritici]